MFAMHTLKRHKNKNSIFCGNEMKTVHQSNQYCFPSLLFLLMIGKFKAYDINPSIQNRGRQQSARASPYQSWVRQWSGCTSLYHTELPDSPFPQKWYPIQVSQYMVCSGSDSSAANCEIFPNCQINKGYLAKSFNI